MPCAKCLPSSFNHRGGCIDLKESQRLEHGARIFSCSVMMGSPAGILCEVKKRAKPHMSYGAQYRNDDRDRMIFRFDRTPCCSPVCRHQLPAASVAPTRTYCGFEFLGQSWFFALQIPASVIESNIEHGAGIVGDHQPDD